jgi:hypothetical protein
MKWNIWCQSHKTFFFFVTDPTSKNCESVGPQKAFSCESICQKGQNQPKCSISQGFILSLCSLGLYYKALGIRNLWKIDRFRNKLVSFLLSIPFTGLDEHTNVNEHTSLLRICNVFRVHAPGLTHQ